MPRPGYIPAMTLLITPTSPHRHRLFEWVTTGMMLGIVIVLILTPSSIRMGAFRYMLAMGFTPLWTAIFFGVLGMLRIVALYLNGHWKVWGPRCRALCALFGCVMWAQMTFALVLLTRDTGTLSLGIPVYFFLAIGEFVSCYRAAVNVHNPDR